MQSLHLPSVWAGAVQAAVTPSPALQGPPLPALAALAATERERERDRERERERERDPALSALVFAGSAPGHDFYLKNNIINDVQSRLCASAVG
jgi:hypothetical protein